MRVRVPQIKDIRLAIQLYHERIELSNADIEILFGKHSSSTVAKLKNLARDKMVQNGVQAWNSQCVNTEAAYSAWGLNISDLENRYLKLVELAKLT